MTVQEKLAALNTTGKSNWSEEAAARRQNRAWLRRSGQIAIKVLSALKQQKLSQKDLADRMGVTAQQVNKIVKGRENLTLETISKLEAALNVPLIQLASGLSAQSVMTEVQPMMYQLVEPVHAAAFFSAKTKALQAKLEQMNAVFSIVQEPDYCSYQKAVISKPFPTNLAKA